MCIRDSYDAALRAALREAPDIILLGEMRDADTIRAAVTAAETGHLVISTLHTVGASSTIDLIVDSFPPEQQQQIRTQLSMVLELSLIHIAPGKRTAAGSHRPAERPGPGAQW